MALWGLTTISHAIRNAPDHTGVNSFRNMLPNGNLYKNSQWLETLTKETASRALVLKPFMKSLNSFFHPKGVISYDFLTAGLCHCEI